MTDMLVKLYGREEGSKPGGLETQGVSIKRAMAFDRALICAFVREQFETPGWVGECEIALSQQPPTCYVAVHEKRIIGFCCWDSTAKGMLGPLGVSASWRGRGVARELIHASLASMREAGYAYAIIGWVSSVEFYAKICGAVPIADSHPGVYSRLASLSG